MPHSILLIDDEPNFCTGLKLLLETDGYDVEIANTGQEALFRLNSISFHAVLLDIGLPDISGIEIATHFCKKQQETAVIMLTGNATVDNAVEALRHGVYDYLRKPCDPEQLLRTISRGIQHKQLEQKLRASEKRFRQLSQATWEGIVIYEEGNLLLANGQLCAMFGYREKELLGQQIFDVLLNRNSIKTMQMETDPDTIGPFEACAIRKDCSKFPVEIRVKHIEYHGRIVQVAAIRDVTITRQALEKQAALQEKLTDAKRMESLGLMAGSVAHDLNNILAGIITYPELLLMDMRDDFRYREEILLIRDAGKRAAAVVSDLLTVVRGSTCKKKILNVNAVISEYINSVESRELCKRFPEISIESDLDSRLLNIECSVVHIAKTLMNLVNNAAEALQKKGTVLITTSNCYLESPVEGYEPIDQGEYVVITVSDDGPGITESDQGQIFNPFYSKKAMGRSGTGLGLAVVWNTVHDHGGFIDLSSSTKGTRFSLYFPVTHSSVKATTTNVSLSDCHGNGENILVVDDQKSQREIARRLLSRLGYRPYTANSGEEAVEFIKKYPVDLVLLDMIMEPGINGCETYQRIIQHVPGQKAIITSGFTSIDEINKAKNLGIAQFIKKPYSVYDLGHALKLEIN
ncbi:MAG: response regulator [Desulfobulbaceae bacterium]|nr:response regulator [Desulfobulbaceae bacterium]